MGAENLIWIKTGHEVPVFSFYALLYPTRNIYCAVRVHSGGIVGERQHSVGLERVGCRGLVCHIVQGLPPGASRGSSGRFAAAIRGLRWRLMGVKKGCGQMGGVVFGEDVVLDKTHIQRGTEFPD